MTFETRKAQEGTVAGLLTLACMLLAFALVNSPAQNWYQAVHHLRISVNAGTFVIDKPLILWINDGLMVFFFMLIAMELKAELMEGQLSSRAARVAPGIAALGGMLMPALIYLALNVTDPSTVRGWAIPTATDAVLALTVLTLLGSRAPVSLVAFLTALAVFDDVGAILIIALFYAEGIALGALVLAALWILLLIALNAFGVARIAPYAVVGALLWLTLLESGIHTTLAGIAIGLAIPLNASRNGSDFSPLRQAERQLKPWIVFGVVPMFAFFNSGIPVTVSTVQSLLSPAALGIVFGLIIGKPLGVIGALWVVIRLGWTRLPAGTDWHHLLGVALLAGVGFTMSLFIAGLALDDPSQRQVARLSVVLGSVLAASFATWVLLRRTPTKPE